MQKGGFAKCALVLVFGTDEHLNDHAFGNSPFANPQTDIDCKLSEYRFLRTPFPRLLWTSDEDNNPVLPFLGFSVLPRKNLKFTKDFLSLPNPQILGKDRENTKITKETPYLKLTKEIQKPRKGRTGNFPRDKNRPRHLKMSDLQTLNIRSTAGRTPRKRTESPKKVPETSRLSFLL